MACSLSALSLTDALGGFVGADAGAEGTELVDAGMTCPWSL